MPLIHMIYELKKREMRDNYEYLIKMKKEKCINKRRDFLECVNYYPRNGTNGNKEFPKKCTQLFWNWFKDCDEANLK